MKYKKSHMDQKVRPYVTKAISDGCNILEIDVQQAQGRIVLGHNWRPKLVCLFDCTLDDYLKLVPAGTIIQLDIKEICFTSWGQRRFAGLIAKAFEPYKGKFEITLSANSGFFRWETMEIVYMFLYLSIQMPRLWHTWKVGKEIETVDYW